ncbi:hypothetical protein GCM10009566_75530 [Streptomyces murinus]
MIKAPFLVIIVWGWLTLTEVLELRRLDALIYFRSSEALRTERGDEKAVDMRE